jgi:hypothetical protein
MKSVSGMCGVPFYSEGNPPSYKQKKLKYFDYSFEL